MNPAKFAQMMKYLTRVKKEKPDLPDVFPASKAPIPPVREDVETTEAINAFIRRERQQKAGGGRIGFDRGGLSDADVAEIRSKLPEGVAIEYDGGFGGTSEGRWRYTTPILSADGSKTRMRLPILNAFNLEADENLKKIVQAKTKGKEVFDLALKIAGKTILTPEKFYELRLEDPKISLDKFLEKIQKQGFVKPDGKPFKSRGMLQRLQQELGIADLVGGQSNAARKRKIEDVKAIIRSAPNGPQILKSITDESKLRKIANALVTRDRLYERRGSFPVGRSKENKMWHNLWRASNQGNRIEVIGEFADGKLPIDSNGRVNWQMPDKNGVPAWKRIQFIDNQKNKATLKWIDMPGSRSLGNQGQLRSQVDNIYGKGFFDRKMKPYDLQKQLGDLEIDLDGQKVRVGTILNENIVKSRLMDKLIKENKGAVPTEEQFNTRYKSYRNKLKLFNSVNVQHTKGVGVDPYTTELTTQSANAKERNIVQKYNAAIKKTTDPTKLLKLSNDFANDISNIAGGIRSFDVQTGTVKGTKATASSIAKQLVDEARLPPEIGEKIINQIATLGGDGCGRGFKNQGGRIGLQDGTPNVDACYKNALERIRKGGVDFTRAEAINFDKLTKGLRAVGASNIIKFGVLPEVLLEGALVADKMASEGDTFAQALRNSYLAVPFQAMGVAKTYEEGEKDRILAAAPESQKGRILDAFSMQDKLNKKLELIGASEGFKKQIAATDAVSDGPFGYVGDTQDLQKRLSDARENLQDLSRGDLNRAERLTTSSPLDLNIQDQLTRDAFRSAVEKADADKASRILVSPGTGFGVDAQIRKRMKDIPINIDTAKEDLKQTGDMFGIGYTPLGLNQLFPALGLQSREFGVDPVTGKYDQDRGLQDYTNYLRTLRFADTFRDEKAGGGIAKLAGVDSGPPPSSGPNSQGLQRLMKRVRNR